MLGMKLTAALIVLIAGATAWRVDLVPRVRGVLYQYSKRGQLDYALAFFTAPNVEVGPASYVLRRTPVPGECREGCLLFDVYSDPQAADLALEFDDGTVVHATREAQWQVRLQVENPQPTEAWLTWAPQVFDPGMGGGAVGCGQSKSMVSIRPTRREGGRVGNEADRQLKFGVADRGDVVHLGVGEHGAVELRRFPRFLVVPEVGGDLLLEGGHRLSPNSFNFRASGVDCLYLVERRERISTLQTGKYPKNFGQAAISNSMAHRPWRHP